MAEKKPQTLANHARFVPLFHVVLFLMLSKYLVSGLTLGSVKG